MKIQAGKERLVAAVSLGCAKNRIDTEEILGLLSRSGYRLTEDPAAAGIIFVNTCAFIEEAQQESIDTILRYARERRGGETLIIAGGCLSERYGRELLKTVPELNGVIGVHSYHGLVEFLKRCRAGSRELLLEPPGAAYASLGPRLVTTAPHSVYVKIAEGCSNRCHYCVIPSLRGPYRSRSAPDIVSEVELLLGRGAREINLVAQDTTAYGGDSESGPDLAGLLKEILAVKGRFWLRLLYAYPTRLTGELIKIIALEPRICKYLDLPLQHVNSEVLRKMGRCYTREEVISLVNRLRREIPDLALRTTYMVGFPGESKRQFHELSSFLHEHPFERVGVFAYSPQQGTPASIMPGQPPRRVGEKRRRALMEAQQRIAAALQRRLIGSRVTVLAEGASRRAPNLYWGRTQHQAPGVDGRIYFRSAHPIKPGSWLSLQVSAASPYDLWGSEPYFIQEPDC